MLTLAFLIIMLNFVAMMYGHMLSVFSLRDAVYHYAECHSVERRGIQTFHCRVSLLNGLG
jgi:hypothetical protein